MTLLMDIQVPMLTETYHQNEGVREVFFGYWDSTIETFELLQVTAQAAVDVGIAQMPQNILNGTNNEIPGEITLPSEEQIVPIYFSFTPFGAARPISGTFSFRVIPVSTCEEVEE